MSLSLNITINSRVKTPRHTAFLEAVFVGVLIPDPSGYRHNGKQKLYLRMLCCATWIWDQSLLTVEINTITRVLRQDICMSCNGRRHDYPRSIVTDHYLLDPDR